MATYMRTGRISWSPLTDTQRGMLAQVAQYTIGEEFTATLDTDTEAFLIGEGVISAVVAVAGGLPAASSARQAPMWTGSEWVADGVPRVVRCPFAFDTPSDTTLYTPLVNDLLIDVWIEVITAFDGTTPFADVGTFPSAYGWFSDAGSAIDLTQADTESSLDASLRSQSTVGNGVASSLSLAFLVGTAQVNAWGHAPRTLPATFVAANPIKLAISQDGSLTGPAIAATHGHGNVYLTVATPATG